MPQQATVNCSATAASSPHPHLLCQALGQEKLKGKESLRTSIHTRDFEQLALTNCYWLAESLCPQGRYGVCVCVCVCVCMCVCVCVCVCVYVYVCVWPIVSYSLLLPPVGGCMCATTGYTPPISS